MWGSVDLGEKRIANWDAGKDRSDSGEADEGNQRSRPEGRVPRFVRIPRAVCSKLPTGRGSDAWGEIARTGGLLK